MDIDTDPSCGWSMDPDMFLGNSPGSDVIMTPVGSAGHCDYLDPMAVWPLDHYTLDPRCEPRFQTSARTWMATGALDISVGPDFSGAHPMPRSWVAAHLTQVCMGPGVAQSSGTKRATWRLRSWALVWPLVVTQATDISSDSGYGRTTWSSAAARAWR